MDISGKYNSNQGELILKQTENKVSGKYSKSGTIEGVVQNNIVSGIWKNADNTGLFEFEFSDTNSFVGKYKFGVEPGTMRGKWFGDLIAVKHLDDATQYSSEVKNGHHVFTDEDGIRYEGNWENDNFIEGKSEYIDEDGEKITEDGVFSDFMLKSGIITYENGTYEKGDFDEDGFLNGNGIQTFLDDEGKEVIEEGLFESGLLKKGKITWADGSWASGTFDDDLELHGNGIYTWLDGDFKDGYWEHGEFIEGKAKITDDDGEISEGMMKDGEWVEGTENIKFEVFDKNPEPSNLSNLFQKSDFKGVCLNADLSKEYNNNILDKILVSSIKTNNAELFKACKSTIDKFRWDWWTKKGNGEFNNKWKIYFNENQHLLNSDESTNQDITKGINDEAGFNEVTDFINTGETLKAIARLKEISGWSLKECKDWVNNNSNNNHKTLENERATETKVIEFKHETKIINKAVDKIKYDNNDLYIGDIDSATGKRHGYGAYIWHNGNYYEGNFVQGKRTGKGIYIYENGTYYVGDFIEGEKTGYGKEYNRNTYKGSEGKFINGIPEKTNTDYNRDYPNDLSDFFKTQKRGFNFLKEIIPIIIEETPLINENNTNEILKNISCDIRYTVLIYGKNNDKYFSVNLDNNIKQIANSVKISLESIFSNVAPGMINEISEKELNEGIYGNILMQLKTSTDYFNKSLQIYLDKKNDLPLIERRQGDNVFDNLLNIKGYHPIVVSNAYLEPESNTIRDDVRVIFMGLGLIEQSIKKRSVHDKETYWKLTETGSKMMVDIKMKKMI